MTATIGITSVVWIILAIHVILATRCTLGWVELYKYSFLFRVHIILIKTRLPKISPGNQFPSSVPRLAAVAITIISMMFVSHHLSVSSSVPCNSYLLYDLLQHIVSSKVANIFLVLAFCNCFSPARSVVDKVNLISMHWLKYLSWVYLLYRYQFRNSIGFLWNIHEVIRYMCSSVFVSKKKNNLRF